MFFQRYHTDVATFYWNMPGTLWLCPKERNVQESSMQSAICTLFLMVEEICGEFLSCYQFEWQCSMLMYTVMELTIAVHISDSVDWYIWWYLCSHKWRRQPMSNWRKSRGYSKLCKEKETLHVITLWFAYDFLLYYNITIMDAITHVFYINVRSRGHIGSMSNSWRSRHLRLHTSMSMAHLSILNRSRIHNPKSIRRWFWQETPPWQVERRGFGQLPALGCRSHKPIHLVRTGRLLKNFPRGNVHAGGGHALAWNERSFSWTRGTRSLQPIIGSPIARLLGLSSANYNIVTCLR